MYYLIKAEKLESEYPFLLHLTNHISRSNAAIIFLHKLAARNDFFFLFFLRKDLETSRTASI